MRKIVVPVDGSANSDRAVRHVAGLAAKGPVEIHLINVQPSLHGDVTTFVGKRAVQDFHREEGTKALSSARRVLDEAGLRYETHIRVGPAAETIVALANEVGAEEIVMGTRGLGSLVGLVLGSVANACIKLANVPVTLVK